jgi:hypothetical protein
VAWDCEGIENPYGWQRIDRAFVENPNAKRLKGRKPIETGTNALVVERVQLDENFVDLRGERVYYWCVLAGSRLLVDARFIEVV